MKKLTYTKIVNLAAMSLTAILSAILLIIYLVNSQVVLSIFWGFATILWSSLSLSAIKEPIKNNKLNK